MHTKKQSLIETTTNIVVGMIVSFFSQKIIFPYFNLQVSTHQNIVITIFFTIISFVRGYGLRRFFNWFFHKYKYSNTYMVDFILETKFKNGTTAITFDKIIAKAKEIKAYQLKNKIK